MIPGFPVRRASADGLRAAVLSSIGLLASLLSTGSLSAQQRDARIPDKGDLWLEFSPELFNWTEQFAENSSLVLDGEREPLFGHFDGPLADRLYPGPQPLIDDLNRDAAALGFDPITVDDFEMGNLEFQGINAQLRRLSAGIEFGVWDRIAVGFRAPFTQTDVEPAFVFDSIPATVMGSLSAFPPTVSFFEDARASMTQLDLLIASGSLMGQELADAIQLRADTDAFLTALELRAGGELLVPTGLSRAGTQMRGRYDGFAADFDSLGLALPDFILPDNATAADLGRFFEDDPIAAQVPSRARTGISFAEFEASMRFGIIDQISPRFEPTPSSSEGSADEGVSGEDVGGSTDRIAQSGPSETRRTVRFRTAVGGLLRVPRATNGVSPMRDPSNFMLIPVADGQTDLEFAIYQDIAIDSWFMLRTLGRYGIQMADQINLRVDSPDQPYSYAANLVTLDRDLGDYFQIVLRPSIRFNSAIWLGLEYDYWNVGNTSFALATEPTPEVSDVSTLELETSQSRHMAGVGIIFDLSEAQSRQDVIEDRLPVRNPWQFGVSFRWSIAGSGGRTPAPFYYAASFRVPIGIF